MIKINNLDFGYGKHKVLSNLTMELEMGKIYGLLGQNGVGKTTLLKILAGLLKADKGECSVNNHIPYDRKPSFLSSIYYLPEDFSAPEIVVESYVKQISVFYPNYSQEKFYKIIKAFDVDPTKKFNKLSFGQQKKAIISLALSLGTDILLLDEPSNGLDIPSKLILRKMIAENIMDNQIVIISTHQVKDLENLIDPIIIIDNYGLIINATIEEISQKLAFSLEPTRNTSALYSEPALNGYITIQQNLSGKETMVDIESLFNCTLANKSVIKEMFKTK